MRSWEMTNKTRTNMSKISRVLRTKKNENFPTAIKKEDEEEDTSHSDPSG